MSKKEQRPAFRSLTALLLAFGLLGGCASSGDRQRLKTPQTSAAALAEQTENGAATSPLNGTIDALGGEGEQLDDILVRGKQTLPRGRLRSASRAGDGKYTLNFENSPLKEVVDAILGGLLETNYYYDDQVVGSVSLQTSRPVPEADLLPLLESMLAMNGAVLTSDAGLYRVLPAEKAAGSPLPLATPRRLAAGGQRLQAIPLNFIAAREMAEILKPMIGQRNVVYVNEAHNFLLVTGSGSELNAALDAVGLFDVNWLKGRSVGVFPLERSEARTVADELRKILDAGDKSRLLSVDTISRLNAVLVIANHSSLLDQARNWIRQLDRSGVRDGTQLFVYEVKNRRAKELAQVLGEAFLGSKQSTAASGSEVAPGLQPAVLKSEGGEADAAAPKAVKAKASHDNGEIRVVADEINNTLLIFTTADRYRAMQTALRQLDTVPRQVLIEASILEVSLTDELSYGLEWFFKNNGVLDGKDGVGLLDLSEGAGFGPSVPGFSYSLVDGDGLIRGVLNMLASDSRLNVISSPSLMVLDNRTANIRVGSQLPVSTGSSTTDGGVVTESIQFKDTGVLLTVTPQVNADGLVTMELTQEVTDVGAIDAATNQRSFLQRNISSTVAIQSGNTVVLGGLITENIAQSETGIPGLRDLPVLGYLFGKTEDAEVRRELLVLITPKVVKSHREALAITDEFRDRLVNMQESMPLQPVE